MEMKINKFAKFAVIGMVWVVGSLVKGGNENLKKGLVLAVVGMGMLVGNTVWGGTEDDGITIDNTKATELNQKIKVTITAPTNATFVEGSWTGPNDLSGDLVLGENEIIASEYSEKLKDYKFVVTWERDKELPWKADRKATLYRHWNAWCFGVIGSFNQWRVKVYGKATPNGAAAAAALTITQLHNRQTVVVKSKYEINFAKILIGAANPVPLSVTAEIDGVLPLSGKNKIGNDITIVLFPLR